jgi:hypothetical protein
MPPQIAALVGFIDPPLAIRGIIPTIFDLGIITALDHVAIQLFVAGLKPSIGDEMMKNMPVLLWDAFQQAITLEKIHTPLKTNSPMVNEIAKENENSELEGEIEAVRAQLQRLTSKKLQFKPQGKFGQQPGGSGYPPNGQTSKPNSNFKDVICRVCRKKGHFQDKCYCKRPSICGCQWGPPKKSTTYPSP